MTIVVVTEVEWECIGLSCYYMKTLLTPKVKSEADAVCAALGAHVAATETVDENAVILKLISESGKSILHGLWGERGRFVTVRLF